MANLVITSARLVKGADEHQLTLPAGVAIVAGQYVKPDSVSGKWALGNAAAAGNIGDGFIALNSAAAGEPVTAVKGPCIVDIGEALAALGYGAPIYLSDVDGTLADTAGTVSTKVGNVMPAWGATTPDKLLRVSLA